MSSPRTIPLFDRSAKPSSWNERMVPGEYAVHYSSFDHAATTGPVCTIFSSLSEAEAYASEQVALRPELRCRIYSHKGLVGAPIREFRGARYKGDNDLTPRFRRIGGALLLGGGLLLVAYDWSHDFQLSWPAMIGVRMIFPGIVLAATEIILLLLARHKAATAAPKETG